MEKAEEQIWDKIDWDMQEWGMGQGECESLINEWKSRYNISLKSNVNPIFEQALTPFIK